MEDDHERAVSVTALSVQFFTAPTLVSSARLSSVTHSRHSLPLFAFLLEL